MKKVIIESPYAGDPRKHRRYARQAMKHSLKLGEAPLASHLLYPQVLKDTVPEQRQQGIEAGLAWLEVADAIAFYADYGFSPGMLEALQRHCAAGKAIEVRYLFKRGPGRAARTSDAADPAMTTIRPNQSIDLGPLSPRQSG